MHELEKRAMDFAFERHAGQKYGDLPYSEHLKDVRNIINKIWPESFVWRNVNFEEEPHCDFGLMARIVAWLHDVVEDTNTSLYEVRKLFCDQKVSWSSKEDLFGQYISNAVAMLTDRPGKNRKERKLKTYFDLARHDNEDPDTYLPHVVKIADRLANVESCISTDCDKLKMYKQEHGMFILACYRKKNPINEMHEAMDRLDYLLGFPKMERW